MRKSSCQWDLKNKVSQIWGETILRMLPSQRSTDLIQVASVWQQVCIRHHVSVASPSGGERSSCISWLTRYTTCPPSYLIKHREAGEYSATNQFQIPFQHKLIQDQEGWTQNTPFVLDFWGLASSCLICRGRIYLNSAWPGELKLA